MLARLVLSITAAVAFGTTDCRAAFSERLNKDCAHGNADLQISACTKYISMGGKPSNMAIRYGNRCSAYMDKKDYDRAISDCSKSIQYDKKHMRSYQRLASAHNYKSNFIEAILVARQAIAVNPRYALAHYELGFAYEGRGEFGAAIAAFREGQRLAPNDPDYQTAIDRVLRAQADAEQRRQAEEREQLETLQQEARAKEAEAKRRIELEIQAKEEHAKRLAELERRAKEEYAKRIAELEARAKEEEQKRRAQLEARLKEEEARRLAALAVPPPATVAPVIATRAGDGFIPADERRIALVIGNGAYLHVARLANPLNDSADVAAALKRLGFAVKIVQDADQETMRRALRNFGRDAQNADFAVVFYAGHGMEIGGENYLIPVDAELRRDIDAEQEALTLKGAMLAVTGAKKLGLVMLDSCRDNPFAAQMTRSVLTRSVPRGLAKVEPVGSVLVAFAAKDGTVADDGSGRNSPFTAALLKHLEAPGVEVNFLFRNVRDDVIDATNKGQEPFVYGSLSRRQIYFKPRRDDVAG